MILGAKRIEKIGNQTLILGDCLDVMPHLDCVDAVVTSPPYGDIRDYGEGFDGVDCLKVIENIERVLLFGGVCMWNVADQTVNGSESGDSFRQALHAKECGLNLHDTMIYCKEGVSFPDSNRYMPCFEYMFIFSKGAPKTFSPLRDRVNKWAGTKMHGTDREKNGSTKSISGLGRDIPNMGMRRNWWVMSNPYKGGEAKHPAPMPYAMADGHIQTWTRPHETVLDPFMGSGTTLVACVNLNRSGIGIELDPEYFDIAVKRVKQTHMQPNLFHEPAPQHAQEGLFSDDEG